MPLSQQDTLEEQRKKLDNYYQTFVSMPLSQQDTLEENSFVSFYSFVCTVSMPLSQQDTLEDLEEESYNHQTKRQSQCRSRSKILLKIDIKVEGYSNAIIVSMPLSQQDTLEDE